VGECVLENIWLVGKIIIFGCWIMRKDIFIPMVFIPTAGEVVMYYGQITSFGILPIK
jgi:hypothetical protein